MILSGSIVDINNLLSTLLPNNLNTLTNKSSGSNDVSASIFFSIFQKIIASPSSVSVSSSFFLGLLDHEDGQTAFLRNVGH